MREKAVETLFGTNLNTVVLFWPELVVPVDDVLAGGVIVPAMVSMPKLPVHEPNTLMKRMPNQSESESALCATFKILTATFALPLVALPALVFFVTEASPVWAMAAILLWIV